MAVSDWLQSSSSSQNLPSTTQASGISKWLPKQTTVRTTSKKADLKSVEGLSEFARSKGLEDEVNTILDTTPKLSALQRISKGLGSLNPAEALLTASEKGLGAGIGKYLSGVVKGVGSAVTGTDYEGERRTFADVAQKMGVDNAVLKFGIGVIGDILLDPSTYFGGAIAKGIGRGVGIGSEVALTGIGKFAPKVEEGLRLAGQGAKEAAGKALVYGYGTSKGLTNTVLDIQTELSRAKSGIVASNLSRLGTGTLTESQQLELVDKLLAGKRAEFSVRKSAQQIALTSDEFLPVSKKIERMAATRLGHVENLQKEVNSLEKSALKKKLAEKINSGPKQLVSGFKIKEVPNRITFGRDDVVTGGRLGRTTIEDIGAKTEVRGENSVKRFIEDLITDPNKDVQALKKLVATRENKLSSLFDDLSALKSEYQIIQNTKFRRLQLADATYAAKGNVARGAAQSSDPLVQKTINEQVARSQRFAKNAGINDPYEVYFPGLKNDSVKNFIEGTRQLRVGSEGYLKQFRNLLTDDELIKNPAEAFAKQEFSMAKDSILKSQLKSIVKDYGADIKAFGTEEEAARAGYKLVREKGMFGKEIGYLKEADKRFIDNLITPEFATIDKIAKATGFDAVTALFKRSVTGLFAPFHVRNFVSGMVQNFETLGVDALNPKNISAGQKLAWKIAKNENLGNEVIEIGGKKVGMGKAFKAFEKRFGGTSSYIADIADATNPTQKGVTRTLVDKTIGAEALPFRAARAIGDYIETQQKATAFLTAMSQGRTIEESLDLAAKAGFDYRALTGLESKVFRRIIPFYSFARKNAELQLKTLAENPQRINQILSVVKNVGEPASGDEKNTLPKYLQESLGIKLSDTPDGLKQYVSNFGTPIEAFTSLFKENPVLNLISMTNPILKVPVEIGIGKDSFRQRDLKDVYDAREYKLAPQFIKDVLEIHEVQKDVLKKDRNGKLVKAGERTQYVADPVRLLIMRSLFTSRGVTYLDQAFGGDLDGFAQALRLLTGVKPQQVDIEAQKAFTEKQQKTELEDLLIRLGEVKKYQSTYVPK